MKLELELIPKSTWGKNLAHLLPKRVWGELRRKVYSYFDYECAICHATNRKLHCHEVWEYDDKRRIQKLKDFLCLCVDCHDVKHWGRVTSVMNEDRVAYLTKHFCRVNNCTEEVFEKHRLEVEVLWMQRSRVKYKVDFDLLNTLYSYPLEASIGGLSEAITL